MRIDFKELRRAVATISRQAHQARASDEPCHTPECSGFIKSWPFCRSCGRLLTSRERDLVRRAMRGVIRAKASVKAGYGNPGFEGLQEDLVSAEKRLLREYGIALGRVTLRRRG